MINRRVQLEDLKEDNRYDKKLIEALQYGDFQILAEYDYDTRSNADFIEPLLWAVKNRFNTYIVYKYYGENLKNNVDLGKKIAKVQPELLKDSPLMRNKKFVLEAIMINPIVAMNIDANLKNDEDFRKEILLKVDDKKLVAELLGREEIKINNDMEIAKFQEICNSSENAIEYVSSHTDEFSKEKLEIAKGIVMKNGCEEAINEFKNRSNAIQERASNGEENIEELLKQDKQLQRHIKTIEKWLKEGKKPERIARLIKICCKDLEPQYQKMLEQYICIHEATIEKQKIIDGSKLEEERNLNTGVVTTSIPPELYEKAAKDFSEGNENLEKLLLNCFKNNIKTLASCAGHKDEPNKRDTNPYMLFEFCDQNIETIEKILEKFQDNPNVEIEFKNFPGERPQFQIEGKKEFADDMFKDILEACSSKQLVNKRNMKPQLLYMMDIMKRTDKHANTLILGHKIKDGKDSYDIATSEPKYELKINKVEKDKLKPWADNSYIAEDINEENALDILKDIDQDLKVKKLKSILNGRLTVNPRATMETRPYGISQTSFLFVYPDEHLNIKEIADVMNELKEEGYTVDTYEDIKEKLEKYDPVQFIEDQISQLPKEKVEEEKDSELNEISLSKRLNVNRYETLCGRAEANDDKFLRVYPTSGVSINGFIKDMEILKKQGYNVVGEFNGKIVEANNYEDLKDIEDEYYNGELQTLEEYNQRVNKEKKAIDILDIEDATETVRIDDINKETVTIKKEFREQTQEQDKKLEEI